MIFRNLHIMVCIETVMLLAACTEAVDPFVPGATAEGGNLSATSPQEEIMFCVPGLTASFVEDVHGKSIAYDRQNSTLDEATRVGVFVMGEDCYESASGLSDAGYGYENVEMAGGGSGDIVAVDGRKIYYPIYSEDKAAALLYAPYDRNFTWQALEKGYSFTVARDQRDDAGVITSDLIIGMPSENPFRNATDPVSLYAYHMLTKVEVSVSIEVTEETLCDSVAVVLNNAPMEVSLSLASLKDGPKVEYGGKYGNIVMAGLKDGISVDDGTIKVFRATAIVAPTADNSGMRVITKFINRHSGEDKYVTAHLPSDMWQQLHSGKVAKYSMYIGASEIADAAVLNATEEEDW